MEMASQSPRAASVKTLSTWHKTASPTEGESTRNQQRVGRQTDRQKGRGEQMSAPQPPRRGLYWIKIKVFPIKVSSSSWICPEIVMKSTVGDGKRRSGLFLGRLWWVGELSAADTCQGFWGYNREAFRKKGCLLTNTGGCVWCTVCVYVCVSICLPVWMHT